MVMRVFVAGGAGVIGEAVGAAARGPGPPGDGDDDESRPSWACWRGRAPTAVVMDGLDAASVGEAVATARPDAIVHQMTAISVVHAGKPDIKHPDRWFATSNRLRTEGTDYLLAAAEATGVPISSRRATPAGTEFARADG